MPDDTKLLDFGRRLWGMMDDVAAAGSNAYAELVIDVTQHQKTKDSLHVIVATSGIAAKMNAAIDDQGSVFVVHPNSTGIN